MASADVLFNIKTQTTEAVKGLGELNQKAEGLGKVMAGLGMIKIGGDILGGLATEIYNVGSAAESGFALVETLMTGSAADIAALKSEITDLAASYGISATAAADAAYQALSAGVEQQNLAGFMESAFQTSIASGADMTTVVDAATTAINAYGLEGEEAERVFNTLMETQNAGKTTVQDFGSNLGKVAPLASTLGISLDQVSAATATMTAQGIGTAEAMTMQKALFSELSNEGSNVSKILKEETGKSFQELTAEGKDLSDIMGILQTAADEDGVSMNNLFSSVEAASGALAIGGQNTESFKNNLARVGDETQEVDSALDVMSGTSEHSTSVIKEQFNAALIDLYNTLMEKAAPALKWIADNMDWLAPILVGVAIAFGVLMIAIGAYAVIAGLAAIAQMALFWPIFLIVLAIMALIAIIIVIIMYWDELKAVTIATWTALTDGIKNAWGSFTSWMSEKWNAFKTGWTNFWTGIKTWVVDTWNSIKSGISNTVEAIRTWVVNKFNAVKDGVVGAVNTLKQGAVNAFNAMKGGIASAVDWVVNKVTSFKNRILSVKDTIVNGFKNMVSGIATGISSGIDTLISKVKSMVNTYMISPLNSAIGIINKIPKVNIPTIPSLAIGTNLVAADGLAYLHKGEAVVPAANVAAGGFKEPGSWKGAEAVGQTINIDTVEVSGVEDLESLVNKIMEAMATKLKGAPKFRKV